MALIEVEDFCFAYPSSNENADAKLAVDHVSLSVDQGDFCIIIGSTGCGKTTLLRCMKPEISPCGKRSGNINVCGFDLVCDGEETNVMSQRESAENIGFIMQHPDDQIVCDTVWHEMAFGLENLGTPPDQMRRYVAEVAHFFGIEDWMDQRTETLSGGQKQLLNLAAVLTLRPKLLLMDEPASQLDATSRAKFYALLSRANQELGITVVMTTHSPEEVERYATRRVDINEPGAMAAISEMEAALRPRWDKLEARLEDGARRDSGKRKAYCIDFSEVYFRYKKSSPTILRGLSVRIKEGCVHALVGGNGCGKSTFLKLAAGLESPQRGAVDNRFIGQQALLPQDPKALFVCDSVVEELAEWQERCGYSDEDIASSLERFDLAEQRVQHPYDLSGGQQQKLALAKLLLCRPRLLLLDEPTKGLDPISCAETVRIVRSVADSGCSVVLVSHDLDFVFAAADEVTMMFDGDAVCTEPASEFFANNLVYRPSERSRLFGALLA